MQNCLINSLPPKIRFSAESIRYFMGTIMGKARQQLKSRPQANCSSVNGRISALDGSKLHDNKIAGSLGDVLMTVGFYFATII